MRGASFLIGLLLPSTTWACTCISYETVPACQAFPGAEVVLRGAQIDNNDTREGFRQKTLYRFEVKEIFKGLPVGTREIFIDPCSGTSCKTSFGNEDYLLYLGKSHNAGSSLFQYQPKLLDAWTNSGNTPVFISCLCSPTRPVTADDPDLDYLRNRSASGDQGWIYGRAVQNLAWLDKVKEMPSVAGATISARASPEKVFTTISDASGAYHLRVPPGVYDISASMPGFQPFVHHTGGRPARVAPGGCLLVNASLQTSNSISGRVLSGGEKPSDDVRVSAAIFETDGRIQYLDHPTSKISVDGRFRLEQLPAGRRLVIGINLDSAPDRWKPYDTTYAPAAIEASAARVFTLGPNTEVKDAEIRLPKRLELSTLEVAVYWPDGTPAIGARAFADWKGKRCAFESAGRKTNVVRMPLVPGREYEIRADHLDFYPELGVIESTAQKIQFKGAEQRVSIVLTTQPPTRKK